MHPVRQNISGHSEVCGDVGVSPAVYNPALQQPAVVRGQVPEEGAKPIRCGMHWGDLGRDGHQIAVPPGAPGTSLRLQPLPAPEIPGTGSKPKGKPRKYQDGPSPCAGTRSGEGWGFLGLLSGLGWGLSAPGSRRGCGSTAAHDFGEHDRYRHTLVTELAESGAGDEVIMSIAGHVSRAMLSRYSHVRMEAKRRALDEIAARQGAADKKRKEEAKRQQQAAVATQAAVIQ